jgi:hypothetical protein
MFGKIDQMSREEVENRLEQLLGKSIEAEIIDDQKDPELLDKKTVKKNKAEKVTASQ